MEQKEAALAKYGWKEMLIPHRLRVLYICQDEELHEVTIWVWLNRILTRSDRAIAHLPSVLGMLYGFGSEDRTSKPADAEKPTFH